VSAPATASSFSESNSYSLGGGSISYGRGVGHRVMLSGINLGLGAMSSVSVPGGMLHSSGLHGGTSPNPSVSSASQPKRSGGGIQVGEHTGFLRMRGLPFNASREDIYRFFERYNPVLESIVLTYRNDGRATGEAYIGFETPDDAKRAMELHRRSMGSRYIELFISNNEEQGRAYARFANR
jgi:heterogeneous nuclear ribonucleoprotein F/H